MIIHIELDYSDIPERLTEEVMSISELSEGYI